MSTPNNWPIHADTAPAGNKIPATVPKPLPDDAPHILVVDDDEPIRSMLSKYLVQNGFRVTPAADAAAARAAVSGLQFDLIILDVMMPGENGIDLARYLKANFDVPICMLTAQADAEHRILGESEQLRGR